MNFLQIKGLQADSCKQYQNTLDVITIVPRPLSAFKKCAYVPSCRCVSFLRLLLFQPCAALPHPVALRVRLFPQGLLHLTLPCMVCSTWYGLLYLLCVCSTFYGFTPLCMIYTTLHDLLHIALSTPPCMVYSTLHGLHTLYGLFHFVWSTLPFMVYSTLHGLLTCMLYSTLHCLLHIALSTPLCMVYCTLHGLLHLTWSIPPFMVYSTLYGLLHIIWSTPLFTRTV